MLLIFLVACLSCSPEKKDCVISVDSNISQSRKHTFVIQKALKNCKFQVRVNFWTDNSHIVSKATMYQENQALFFKISKPKSEFFKLFDFKLNKGEVYKAKIPLTKGEIENVDVLLQNKYEYNSNEIVYQFIVFNGYDYFGEKLHQVIFISSKRGFIGNYFQDPNEENYIITPVGDILRDVIDYSNSEFRVLK